MELNNTIKEIMTKQPLSVHPDTPLIKATDILLKNDFNGLPVTDVDGTVVGILTEYDLTMKESQVYLPTLLKLFKEIKMYKKDRGEMRDNVKKILAMKVNDVMNHEPLLLEESQSIEEAFDAFGKHHRVNPIPIINKDKKLVGILSRYDLIKFVGAPSVKFETDNSQRQIDKNINNFLGDFERHFYLVSKYRTRNWLLLSLLFALVGFIIAFAIIIRIQ